MDDYACLIDGLIELFQTTFETNYLDAALELTEQMISRFEDSRGSGFFFTAIDGETLIARNKDTQDNATPSGGGMAACALAKLGTLTGRVDLLGKAYATLESMSGQLERFAMASGQALLALDFVTGPTQEIIVLDAAKAADSREGDTVLRSLSQKFWPNKVVARIASGQANKPLPNALKELLAGKTANSEAVTVFVCERGTCQAPLVGLAAWQEHLSLD